MRRCCRIMLRLYPYDYRLWFEPEMREMLGRRAGLREYVSLAAGCLGEWIAKLTTDPAVRGRALPDVRMMRPVGVPRQDWYRPCSSAISW